MSEPIPPELVDKMMVKCARRCCICRRFRPTKLQVHHILERNQGGDNDEDNLIVVCFSCHSDVHTKVPFARRFSIEELKGHRDALVRMVEQGVFPAQDTDDADKAMATVLQALCAVPKVQTELSAEATEILLAAANTMGNRQGRVLALMSSEGLGIGMGDKGRTIANDDARTQAKYKQAIKQLVGCGLLEACSKDVFALTYDGYLAADEIMVSHGQACTDP